MTKMTTSKKLRSIDFLSAEQLQRKRHFDRTHARQARERAKAHTRAIELKVEQLEQQNYELRQQLLNCQCHILQGSSIGAVHNNAQSNTTMISRKDSWLPISMQNQATTLSDKRDPCAQVLDIELLQIFGMQSFDSMKYATSQGHSRQFPEQIDDSMCFPPSSSTSGLALDVALLTADRPWLMLPQHTSATCLLDHVVSDIIRVRRRHEIVGGNLQEFQDRPFPSIQSLLNPIEEAERSPVTSSIVTNIIRTMTVPTLSSNLPEQIAILYFMSSIIRWQISPTEANYMSMPEWLRPTTSQLTMAHPVWIDLFVWPKARERFCRNVEYHQLNAIITEICNESLSVNWPYKPSDTYIHVNEFDIILNPVFDSHIQHLENWSLGPRLLEVFPELASDVNIGLPRTAHG